MPIHYVQTTGLIYKQEKTICWLEYQFGIDSDQCHSLRLAPYKAVTMEACRCPWVPNSVWPRHLDISLENKLRPFDLYWYLGFWLKFLGHSSITNQVWLKLKKLCKKLSLLSSHKSCYFVIHLGSIPATDIIMIIDMASWMIYCKIGKMTVIMWNVSLNNEIWYVI